MAVSRVIEVSFGRSSVALVRIDTAYFYNNGIIFKPTDIDLPASYQVHWADSPQASSTLETIGTAEGAPIPDGLWDRSRVIYGWIYLHPTEDSGITGYEVRIYKNVRAGLPDGTEPTPAEQSTIDQAISALNTAVAKTAQDVISADQSARSASGDADRAERARTGAETAQGKAEDAQESAERAKDDAETSERNASESERNAKGYAETASEKADAITGLTAQATTLPDGSSATASYDAETGVMSFGIPKGRDGTDGDDGYSPTANVSKTGKVATITITDKNGTTSAQVEDGTDGIDGISPSVSVTDITGGHRVVITDKDGAKSFDVEDGATGATPNLTIGTVETLEPTESATATITGTPENPVLNLGIPQGDAGEVSLADLNSALIEKAPVITDTASGAIASFSDGADDLPLKSLIVDINPIQDLHGQDAPYPAGGGKNLSPLGDTSPTTNAQYIINNANLPVGAYVVSFDMVNCTYVNGTAALLDYYDTDDNNFVYPIPSYIRRVSDDTPISQVGSPINGRFYYATREHSISKIVLHFRTDGMGQWTGEIKNVQLELGSTPTAYAPYENICPISGWTGVQTNQSGVNVWDEEWEVGGIRPQDGSLINEQRIRSKNLIPCVPNTTYYILDPTNNNNIRVFYYAKDGSYIGCTSFIMGAQTTPNNARFMRFIVATTYGTTYNHDISINYPSTDHSYHPYTGRHITIDLGQTVYGGKLDVLSGELVIDKACVDLGSLTWIAYDSDNRYYTRSIVGRAANANMICSQYWRSVANFVSLPDGAFRGTVNDPTMIVIRDTRYSTVADFTAAMSGVQLVYELATPITYTLDPIEVSSLLGQNNLWADSGDTDVEYRADTKLYIERLIAPDSADMIADSNIVSGQYFMVGNTLYKATANIANGGQIIVGTNATQVSLAQALNEINA